MAQDGLWASGKHRGHPPGSSAEDGVPDGVHALVQAVEPIRREAGVDCAPRNPEPQQLPARHNAMLLLRELGKATIEISTRRSIRAFTTHIVVNARLVRGDAGWSQACGRW